MVQRGYSGSVTTDAGGTVVLDFPTPFGDVPTVTVTPGTAPLHVSISSTKVDQVQLKFYGANDGAALNAQQVRFHWIAVGGRP